MEKYKLCALNAYGVVPEWTVPVFLKDGKYYALNKLTFSTIGGFETIDKSILVYYFAEERVSVLDETNTTFLGSAAKEYKAGDKRPYIYEYANGQYVCGYYDEIVRFIKECLKKPDMFDQLTRDRKKPGLEQACQFFRRLYGDSIRSYAQELGFSHTYITQLMHGVLKGNQKGISNRLKQRITEVSGLKPETVDYILNDPTFSCEEMWQSIRDFIDQYIKGKREQQNSGKKYIKK